MITDNRTFYLCNLKDFQKVIQKSEKLKGLDVLNLVSGRETNYFDEKGLAYWSVPFYTEYRNRRFPKNYFDSVENYLLTLNDMESRWDGFDGFKVMGIGTKGKVTLV